MIKYRIQNVDAVRFFQVMLALLITTVIMAGEVSPVYAADAASCKWNCFIHRFNNYTLGNFRVGHRLSGV